MGFFIQRAFLSFFSTDVIEVITDCECIGPGDVFTLFCFYSLDSVLRTVHVLVELGERERESCLHIWARSKVRSLTLDCLCTRLQRSNERW